MQSVKQQVLAVLKSLPDDCTIDDIRYHLYLRRKVEEGLQAADTGNVFSTAQAVDSVRAWSKSSESANS
jgi:hypothetical protein